MNQQQLSAQQQQQMIRQKLAEFDDPSALQNALDELDKNHKPERIFIMGCGRSGTWLLTSMFSTFQNVALIPKELPFEYFGLLNTDAPNLVVKRDFRSFERVERIPERIKIIWIVRHPYSVLTSHNPIGKAKYHIKPFRLLGEMFSLKYLIESSRLDCVVKYEDLVTDPEGTQKQIASDLGLEIAAGPEEIPTRFNAPPEAESAMHGIRKIDTNSVYKYLEDPEKIKYLKTIFPRVEPALPWLKERFGYDFLLPE